MAKTKQNLFLFIEPPIDPWSSPSKIGNSYINRFVIDEEASFELLGVNYLSKAEVAQWSKYFEVRQKPDQANDNEIVECAIQKSAEYKTKLPSTHFIFAGDYCFSFGHFEPEIVRAMKLNNIENIMATKLQTSRQHLITKELMEEIYMGEYYNGKHTSGNMFTNKSVFEDLESFYKNIKFRSYRRACTNRYGDAHYVQSYFLPKLTEKEMKLVEHKDKTYMATFENIHRDLDLPNSDDPDVNEGEMKLSESKSKFVLVECNR